jgi:hypothetical protein
MSDALPSNTSRPLSVTVEQYCAAATGDGMRAILSLGSAAYLQSSMIIEEWVRHKELISGRGQINSGLEGAPIIHMFLITDPELLARVEKIVIDHHEQKAMNGTIQ